MTQEHRLRIGGRDVLLVEGPAGWGECSPFPGYPCDPDRARRSAEEAATIGWPDRVRDGVPVNAYIGATHDLGTGPTDLIDGLGGCTSVKVKVGRASPAADIDRIARVRDIGGPTLRIRVDANGHITHMVSIMATSGGPRDRRPTLGHRTRRLRLRPTRSTSCSPVRRPP